MDDDAKLSYTMPILVDWFSEETPRFIYPVRYGGAEVSTGRTNKTFYLYFSLII